MVYVPQVTNHIKAQLQHTNNKLNPLISHANQPYKEEGKISQNLPKNSNTQVYQYIKRITGIKGLPNMLYLMANDDFDIACLFNDLHQIATHLL